MASKSDKDKERLVQAAQTFFLHIQDFATVTNTLTELFNSCMNSQIITMVVKEDSYVKEVFEQMVRIFKEMQSVVAAKDNSVQKTPIFSKIATAMCTVVDKNTKVKELQPATRERLAQINTPFIVSLMSSGNIISSLESALQLLTMHPIMSLQIRDFHRKDTNEQSGATTSMESSSAGPSKVTTVDNVKKLQNALKIENAKNTIASAAEQLEQIVKNMRPTLEILQKAIQTLEISTYGIKKVND
ncbi:uncharacterized protein C12orf60 homolog [Pipistrellus kuhlii]|uniref:Uncharacterized protein n=1 Tax=Pipistrellus kuhlii TaxID=59472 RepID=A0A7J7ZFW7_PIPKU|nr:uncharacterized protein C12orf60 homolog [Pipistrellus kuhlii]KAF6373071.1 hypothetical protein mPipKuh1_001659 [Pipistrellus kuhlii]